LAIVLSVEFAELCSDHLQRQFDRLKCVHASSIFDTLTTNARNLKWTILVIPKCIGRARCGADFETDVAG
jgi:hypothetical protein